MLDDNKYDLIDRFFNNELNDAERITFEQLLADDVEFREGVLLQRSIIGGIEAHGKEELKKELAAIFIAAKPEIEKQKYKPQSQRNFFTRILKWLIAAAAIGAVAFAIVQHYNKVVNNSPPGSELEQERINSTHTQQSPAPRSESIHRDTVWHTIHVYGGVKRDTINAYSLEEAKEKIKKMRTSDSAAIVVPSN